MPKNVIKNKTRNFGNFAQNIRIHTTPIAEGPLLIIYTTFLNSRYITHAIAIILKILTEY